MSVLINMEMPTSCGDCRFAVDGWCYACPPESEAERQRITTNYCPLRPVPPHGDLIDRDAYEKLLRGFGSRDYRREKGTICDAIKFLHPHYAPTIIPAEEGET